MSITTRDVVQVSRDGEAGTVEAWRPVLRGLLVLALCAGLLVWWTRQPGPLVPAATGESTYLVTMHDYRFTPERMTWQVGEDVTLILVNDSEAHPGKAHEFMLGRQPRQQDTLLGTRYEDGFHNDFFAGLRVWFGNAQGVEMLMAGEATLIGEEVSQHLMESPMDETSGMSEESMGQDDGHDDEPADDHGMEADDPGMDMDSPHPSQSPSDHMETEDESADDHGTETDDPGMEADDHGMDMAGHGLMVSLEHPGRATLRFTVPDAPGSWTFGCFEQSGQHFVNGMRGTVTIVDEAEGQP